MLQGFLAWLEESINFLNKKIQEPVSTDVDGWVARREDLAYLRALNDVMTFFKEDCGNQ